MDPVPPRRGRQTTDIAHVTIECCQFTVEPAPLFDRRNPHLGTKHVQKVPDSDAPLVAPLANRERASARWHMVIQDAAMRSPNDQRDVHTLPGRPLPQNGDATKLNTPRDRKNEDR